MSGARILVVDDDPAILKAVNKGLSGAGFDVTGVATAGDVVPEYQRVHPDVVVLDLVLPDGDGISVCAEIRKLGATPVIVLSAIGDDERKVQALNTGADDYLVKPFSMAELQARINVAIRRSTPQASTRLSFDVIELDLLSRKVTAGGVEVRLTPTEFELLRLLLTYPGRVFTQRHLLATIWGPEYQEDAHILRTFVHQLRTKLSAAAPASGALIVNDPGIGYRIELPSPRSLKSSHFPHAPNRHPNNERTRPVRLCRRGYHGRLPGRAVRHGRAVRCRHSRLCGPGLDG